MPAPNTLERLMRLVGSDPSGCWPWGGSVHIRTGYGIISFQNQRCRAHRFVYEMLVGPIPDGLVLDHLCRRRDCVNPAHLEPVTVGENVRRGVPRNSKRTECVNGHPFTPENTYRGMRPGYRVCRACNHARTKAYRSRKKVA